MLSGTAFWRCWFGKTGESEILHYFLPCLVICPPVSKDHGDATRGDGEGPAAGKCLWFLSLLVWVLSLLGFFFPLSSQISMVKVPKAASRAQALPEGPREHQPTWKQQKTSRTQKISQKLTQST